MAAKKNARANGGEKAGERRPRLPDGMPRGKSRGVERFTDPNRLSEAVCAWARATIIAGLGPPPSTPPDPPGFEGLFAPTADLRPAERLADFEEWLAELVETARANPLERQRDAEARRVAAQLAEAIRAALDWANAPSVPYWRSSERLALAQVMDDEAWPHYLARLSTPLGGVAPWTELAFLVQEIARPVAGEITRSGFGRRSPMTLDELTAAIILSGRTGVAEAREAISIQVDAGYPGATVKDGVDATRKRVRNVLRRSNAEGRKQKRKD